MNGMTRMLIAFFLATSTTVSARDGSTLQSGGAVEKHHWRNVDPTMSADEYQTACRHNQRMVRDTLKSFSEEALASIGVPEAGVEFMGAAVGMAVRDARFHLNESKTLALELLDVADDNRALFLGIKMDW